MATRSLPRSISDLLECFRGCFTTPTFTTPTFTTFCGLALGFWAQPGLHTVCGMLCGARLEQVWHHSRAHRFFSAARWSADQLGLVLLDLICALLPPGRLGQQLGRGGRAGLAAVHPAPQRLPADPGPPVAAGAHPRTARPGHRAGEGGLRPPWRPPRRPGL